MPQVQKWSFARGAPNPSVLRTRLVVLSWIDPALAAPYAVALCRRSAATLGTRLWKDRNPVCLVRKLLDGLDSGVYNGSVIWVWAGASG